ncbi:hypothetical protein [Shewanella algidipiscicola]|uniref:hypothetical protein n=1 Tax=Shewanella algidipiscicola TaxID=614070 RepID=UPI000E75E848|nr:hypothetical protein [Shewanella algidipiscicola]
MPIKIIALLLALMLLLYLFKHRLGIRRKKITKKARSKTKAKPISEYPPFAEQQYSSTNTNFHSVEIVNDAMDCTSAHSLQGKRYLSAQAPMLPLKGCSTTPCRCRYIHHADRRKFDGERRLQFGVTHELYGTFGEQNRRSFKHNGRRQSDQP